MSLSPKYFEAGRIFTPGSPINDKSLFSGRWSQTNKILDAVSQRGYHAVLYGERGVGKTSMSLVLSEFLREVSKTKTSFLVPRVNCDGSDDFNSLWRKILRDIVISKGKPGLGFHADDVVETASIVDALLEKLTPDDVRRVVAKLSAGLVLILIFDEFDRIADLKTTSLMADTIKAFSDYSVAATILIIGVADSVDQLIHQHQSIERALIQVPMPRMSSSEISDIVTNGLGRLSMSISEPALTGIVSLSQGLPYITHLLALHSTRAAIVANVAEVDEQHIDRGIKDALNEWQQSIKSAYYTAVRSQQPDNIFKQVLLACCLADSDALGYFSAGGVRRPLREITGKNYDIPNFARHLKEFSGADRGSILTRTGQDRRVRYRFTNPLMQPYIMMRGVDDGLISRDKLDEILG